MSPTNPPSRESIAFSAIIPLLFVAWAFTTSASESSARDWTFASDAGAPIAHFSDVTVTMDGASERPKAITTDATGTAKFSWSETSPISFTVEVKNLSSKPTGAHIHGPAGVDGTAGPIVTLPIDSVVWSGRISTGSIDMQAAKVPLDSLKKLIRNGMAYVNVHTEKNPGGEIRGQFKKP